MTFCSNCNENLEPEFNFCPYCGTSLHHPENSRSNEFQSSEIQSIENETSKNLRNAVIIIIAIVGITWFIIAYSQYASAPQIIIVNQKVEEQNCRYYGEYKLFNKGKTDGLVDIKVGGYNEFGEWEDIGQGTNLIKAGKELQWEFNAVEQDPIYDDDEYCPSKELKVYIENVRTP